MCNVFGFLDVLSLGETSGLTKTLKGLRERFFRER